MADFQTIINKKKISTVCNAGALKFIIIRAWLEKLISMNKTEPCTGRQPSPAVGSKIKPLRQAKIRHKPRKTQSTHS